jgi:hypothetical protein
LRRFDGRALQQVNRRKPWLAVAAGMFMLVGCANEGIWPKEELPAAPPGPPLPTPSFQSRDSGTDDERGMMTEIERQQLEERLTKLARDREKGVAKRIDSSKK